MAKKPLLLLALDLAALAVGILTPSIWYPRWTLVVPAALFVLLIVALLWRSAGLRGYFSYRTPLVCSRWSPSCGSSSAG